MADGFLELDKAIATAAQFAYDRQTVRITVAVRPHDDSHAILACFCVVEQPLAQELHELLDRTVTAFLAGHGHRVYPHI